MNQHSNFVHLHVHTQYSLLDGACKIDPLLNLARNLRSPALAITDHGNLFGVIEFYQKCMTYGIKPIIGCELYIAPYSRFEKSAQRTEGATYHIILLARDEQGYKNLMKLVSIGFLEGFYYKPRIDKEVLRKYSGGLIGLSACLHGEIIHWILAGKIQKAESLAGELSELFGKGNFYLELQDNKIAEQRTANKALIDLSKKLSIPVVATNDVHYLNKSDACAHDALLCIQTQTTLSNPQRLKFSTDEFYFKSAQEMRQLFAEVPDALTNTVAIAEMCNIEFNFTKTYLPQYKPPQAKTREEFLRQLCLEGLEKRYKHRIDETVMQRLNHELEIIKNSGYISYFLIAWDFIHYAKEKGIPHGPGRGSAAGSLVSYTLGITDIDPLKYGLIFERFLNPERVSLPDIDIDFCYERRNEVINYVVEKYGKANVAQIITFGTMGAKAVVRDVGRVMAMPYAEVDKIAKLIPGDLNITLTAALQAEPELKILYKNNPQIKALLDTSLALEGLTRHASTHAAGVVISEGELTDYAPLFKTSDGQITTGVDMSSLEKIGLLKMDFLGLRTLTVIDETIKIIKRMKAQELDIENISLEDKKTFQLLSLANTLGVFQLESKGMRDLLKKLKPEKFEDLVALLAIYRPGPIGSGMVDEFIKRKHTQASISYDDERLKPILEETYGIIIFQEQVMQIASELAGFTLSQADILRRAMSKKSSEVMEEQRKHFIDGCAKNGINKKIANKVFSLIEYFAGYGFNKCVVGSTELINANTGEPVTVEELYANRSFIKTFSCDEKNLKIISQKIKDIVCNGVKKVYRLKTHSGKEITVTYNHPFLTISGWKQLQDLQVGEMIATPRKIPLSLNRRMGEYKIISLANLLSEGNLCHTSGLYFYSNSKKEKERIGKYWREIEKESGICVKELYGGIKPYKKGFRRNSIKSLAEYFDSAELLKYATSDIYWDRIISIEYVGEEKTYDIEMEQIHNFIANGIIVHNSHSAAYALISYRTAYLKANFPVAFMTALLTSEKDNTDKIVSYINEANKMGIEILSPDVNESFAKFTMVGEKSIRFGLSAVKNVGQGAIDSIISARNKYGRFDSLYKFCEYIDSRLVNRKVIESLIKCGAFDSLGLFRSQLMATLEQAMEVAQGFQKDRQNGQLSLFDQIYESRTFKQSFYKIPDIPEWPENQLLSYEKQMLGFYITGHPLARYAKTLKNYATHSTQELTHLQERAEISIGGIINKLKTITTKRNERMAIVNLEDLDGFVEVLIFPKVFSQCFKTVKMNSTIFVKGRVNRRDREPKIVAEELIPLSEVQKHYTNSIIINLFTPGLEEAVLSTLKDILRRYPGKVPVYLGFRSPDNQQVQLQVNHAYYTEPSEKLVAELESVLGEGVVALRT